MISLILTALYLAKDTVHRWFTRVSSPLARVLVVFFLSLCALFFLGSYVITAKVIQDRILSEGGDLVHAVLSYDSEEPVCLPTEAELEHLLQVESYVLRTVAHARTTNKRFLPVYTFDFARMGQWVPLMAPDGSPTILCPSTGKYALPQGPTDVFLPGERAPVTVMTKHLPEGHALLKMLHTGGLIVMPDEPVSRGGEPLESRGAQVLLRVKDLKSADDLRRVEAYMNNLMRLEGVGGSVSSAANLIRQMDVVLSNQMQCRAAFCLGIVFIVGILLTALAGMEYRQNEYIYTLMKSFGIHPFLLIINFLVENFVLVCAAFAAALFAFMKSQNIILEQFFKLGQYQLGWEEIMPEIRLIVAALLVCIAISSLPIVVAAHREIGRVLK